MVSAAALLGITLFSCTLSIKEFQARAGCASTGHDNIKFYCPTRHSCKRLLLGLKMSHGPADHSNIECRRCVVYENLNPQAGRVCKVLVAHLGLWDTAEDAADESTCIAAYITCACTSHAISF